MFKSTVMNLEQTLKQLSDLNIALIETSLVAITDEKRNILFINDNFCALSKYGRNELIGQDFQFLLSDPHSLELLNGMQQSIGQGRVWREEIKYCTKDGTFYWVITTVVPFLNEQGIPYQYVFIGTDITGRKLAEETLDTLIAASPDFVNFKDGEGRWLKANDVALRLFELENVDYIGKTDRELAEFSSNYRDALVYCEESDAQAWKAGQTTHTEEWIPNPDGSFQIFDAIKVPVFYPNGARRGIVVIGRNITERKLAENELKKTLKELKDIHFALDESSILAITDHKGIITHVNRKFCEISKYEEDELVGQDHRILNSGYHGKEFFKEIWETIGDGRVWKGEIQNKAKDGSYYWVDTTIVPFLNDQGKPYQYVVIRSDITERKQAEEMLKILNEEKSNYLSTASHELKTPLSIISGTFDLLINGYMGDFLEEDMYLLRKTKFCIDTLKSLINDLLDVSKLENAQPRFDIQPYYVHQLLSQTVENVKLAYAYKERKVQIQPFPCEWVIQTNAIKFQQLLSNLLLNAFRFSEDQSTVTLSVRQEADQRITVCVEDEGIGIPAESLHRIFERFYQVEKGEARKYGGVGLGLAISKQIAEAHGGRIWAESELCKGSKFYFSI